MSQRISKNILEHFEANLRMNKKFTNGTKFNLDQVELGKQPKRVKESIQETHAKSMNSDSNF